ncbi:MAG: hypothetical protein IJX77_09160 [Ruminococcus sp.]|nr:hypothetical protein [Ruminococcus sp.]
MRGTDFQNTADEAVKIYVPRSFSGNIRREEKPVPESEEVKIYSGKEKSS